VFVHKIQDFYLIIRANVLNLKIIRN